MNKVWLQTVCSQFVTKHCPFFFIVIFDFVSVKVLDRHHSGLWKACLSEKKKNL